MPTRSGSDAWTSPTSERVGTACPTVPKRGFPLGPPESGRFLLSLGSLPPRNNSGGPLSLPASAFCLFVALVGPLLPPPSLPGMLQVRAAFPFAASRFLHSSSWAGRGPFRGVRCFSRACEGAGRVWNRHGLPSFDFWTPHANPNPKPETPAGRGNRPGQGNVEKRACGVLFPSSTQGETP